MTGHAAIRRQLYDYATGALTPEERERVRGHLSRCRRCAGHFERMESALPLASRPESRPSDRPGPDYWASFADRVETRIRRRPRQSLVAVLGGFTDVYVLTRRRAVASAGALLALVVLLSFFLRPARDEAPPVQPLRSETTAEMRDAAEVGQFMRRARVLLVGLQNIPQNGKGPVDLRSERRLSRELLREGRVLRERPLDVHTARLVRDMQKVLLTVSNADDQGGAPDVEIIREGIQRGNLLFKIRMAEAAYVRAASSERDTP